MTDNHLKLKLWEIGSFRIVGRFFRLSNNSRFELAEAVVEHRSTDALGVECWQYTQTLDGSERSDRTERDSALVKALWYACLDLGAVALSGYYESEAFRP